MKKDHIIIGVAGAILLLIVVIGIFQKNSDDVFIVRANDGVAELRIPKDAILAGGAIEDITMTAIAPADFFKESNQPTDSVKVYKLEPDGLTLSRPATLSATFSYDSKKAYFPIILVQSEKEGTLGSLTVTDVEIDEERGTLIVSSEVGHFSNYIVNPNIDAGIFAMQHSPEGEIDLPLGQSLQFALTVTPGVWEYVTEPDKYGYGPGWYQKVEIVDGTRWVVHPWFIGTLGNLEPKRATFEETSLNAAEAYRVTTTFTCRNVGYDHPSAFDGININYVLKITAGQRTEEPRVEQYDQEGWLYPRSKLDVHCVTPPRTQTPPSGDVRSSEETPPSSAAPTVPKTSGGMIKVCGLPGGPACPKR